MINRFIFSQVNLDSGSLTVLASVVHKLSESGVYYGKITRGENEVGRFKIVVDQTSTASSIKIDLKALDLPPSQLSLSEDCNCFNLDPNGHAVFLVSTGAGGYTVEIEKSGNECGKKVFDNRELSSEDLFVATLLRPGAYRIVNVLTKVEAKLNVAYPEIGKTPRNSPPVKVECTDKAITPSKIAVNPGQSIVFSFKVHSRVKIELVEPEDRNKQEITSKKQAKQTKIQSKGELTTKQVVRRLRLNPL